jgi:cephalosporin hydroxylase
MKQPSRLRDWDAIMELACQKAPFGSVVGYRQDALAIPTRKLLNMHGPLKYQDMVYVMIRALKPDLVFETGVRYGVCTTHVLAAMHINCRGLLVSCDPMYDSQRQAQDRIHELVQTPLEYFDHWKFMPGKSSEWLPEMLKKHSAPNIFIHDSDHGWENMSWELDYMFEAMKKEQWSEHGTIICDDWDWLENEDRDLAKNGNVFEQFAEKHSLDYHIIGTAAIARL